MYITKEIDMSSVNEVRLLGNLGCDPQVNFTKTGSAVCNFRIATNEQWTDKEGHKQERVTWHRIVAWAKLGERCGEYLSKGRQVYVTGKLQNKKYTDQNGVLHYTTGIVANDVKFLGGKHANTETSAPVIDAEEDLQVHSDEVPF